MSNDKQTNPPPGKRKQQEQQRTYGKKSRILFRRSRHKDMFFPDTDKVDLNPPKVPERPAPRSQKEATMAVEPPEDAVQMLLGLGKTDSRDVVVRYLKAKHNNIEAAAMALLDDEDISQAEKASTWDESVFGAGRDGEPADQYLHAFGTTTPHTRANSPAGNRANLHPSSKDEEDADLAAALSASQQHLGSQESGIIKSNGSEEKKAFFGPATKDYYDKSQWAMVPTMQDTAEVVPEVDIELRKNVPGEPRFLKHVPTGDYLSAFLTICHAIAGVREAMLMREHIREEYGQDSDWWRGHSIPLPRIVYTDSGAPAEPDDKYDELIAEVQRLMAFLDAGDRSYVSPGALTQTAAIRNVSPSNTKSGTLVEHFIQEWMVGGTAKSKGAEMGELFTTTVFSEDLNKADDCERFLLNLPVSAAEGDKVDLSELLDGCFWGQDTTDIAESGDFVNSPADVIVIRLVQADRSATQLRAEVPSEFYMDKYLRENREAAHQIRQQLALGKGKLRKIEAIEKKLTTWKHPTKPNVELDARLLLKHTYGHFANRDHSDGQVQENTADAGSSSTTINGEVEAADNTDIASQLNTIISSIDSKLTVLAAEKEKTRKALADMSKHPLPILENPPNYRYTLRGVSTKPNITYVLRPIDDDDSDEDEAMPTPLDEDGTPDGMQWWRIEYDGSSSAGARVTKTRTPDYDVLRAVELEHREALLVYASDDANDIRQYDPVLSEPLREFVKKDNALFKRDLIEAGGRSTVAPPAYDFGGAVGVRQSIEKRDSMDSTRAQGVGEDDEAMFLSDDEGLGGMGDGTRDRGRDAVADPPEYEMEGFENRDGFALGPGKMGHYEAAGGLGPSEDGADDGVHEIRLDEPGASSQTLGRDGPVSSQDAGVGGSTSHVEDMMELEIGKKCRP